MNRHGPFPGNGGLGQGSSFRVTLPNARRTGVEDGNGAAGPPQESQDGPLRVLFVEDDPMTARIMARLLRRAGHHVTTANTLADALRAALGPFDLVVSDIGLPDGSGLDLMRHVRARSDTTPGIALTGFGMEDDLRRSLEAGFVAHLTKPVVFEKLDALIRSVAGAYHRRREAAANN
jgi:DNA-binding response OmpR family regulator